MYARIVLLSKPFSTLTYQLPDCFPDAFWQPGLRVAVPLGNMIRVGYIESFAQTCDLARGIRCKTVIWPLDLIPTLSEELLALARDLAARQGISAGEVYGHILPAFFRRGDVSLEWQGQKLGPASLAGLDKAGKAALAADYIAGKVKFLTDGNNGQDALIYGLACDPPWPIRPGAKKQIAVLEELFSKGATNRKRLLKSLGPGYGQVLDRLVASGFVRIMEDFEDTEAVPESRAFKLNEEQTAAVEELKAALATGELQNRLLFGITGSGKTAVYMEVIAACLDGGRSAFLAAPEVALAHKLYADAQAALPGRDIVFYHGYQTASKRKKTFSQLIGKDRPCLVVGTRSALFLPVPRPGCVILDEEHDGSFKQDESFIYHAREVAWFRMKYNKGLVVLGSATPDLKTYYAGESGRLPMLKLTSRVGGSALPPVELVDIGKLAGKIAPGTLQADAEGIGMLAPRVEEALRDRMKKGEQAVILMNRRGYAPLIYCVRCAKVLHCPQCAIGLAYHKATQRLVCHYCGYSVPYPSPCPECHHTSFMSIGEGTERIAERLEGIAGQPILRLDRDSARREGRLDEILSDFRAGKSPFLVGTQMLSKGHHFPNVTLVVVADGDIGLNLPDYRSAERTFQLLVQSGGRAGRGEKPGSVLIQTRDVDHYCWKFVCESDYEGFYREELARRRKRLYPPFVCLGLLRLSFDQKDEAAKNSLRELRPIIGQKAKELGVRALGPAPAPIAMLSGRLRFQCLLKAGEWNVIRELYFAVLREKAASRMKITLDLDPVNML